MVLQNFATAKNVFAKELKALWLCVRFKTSKKKKLYSKKKKKPTKKCLLDEKERKTTKKCLLDARKRNVFGAV